MSPLTDAQRTLVRRARAFVQELGDFLMADEETLTGPPTVRPPLNETDEERTLRFHVSGEVSTRDSRAFSNAYHGRFSGTATALAEAFAREGITPPADFQMTWLEHVTNKIILRAVMTAIGHMAEQLELRG